MQVGTAAQFFKADVHCLLIESGLPANTPTQVNRLKATVKAATMHAEIMLLPCMLLLLTTW